MRNLDDIRLAYQRGEGSLRELAERFSVPVSTIKKRAASEKWNRENGTTGAVGSKSGSENGTTTSSKMEPPLKMEPQSGTTDPSGSKSGGENGTGAAPKMEPPPKMEPKNGTAEAVGSKSGGEKGTGAAPKMEPPPKNGTSGGSGFRNGSTSAFSIPSDINSMNMLEAARFYHGTLGWAVHPLYPNDQGKEDEKGKKPLMKGWRSHTAAAVDPDDLARNFADGSHYNLGAIARPPFVHVDLDSKCDHGHTVMEWLGGQPELAHVPRERSRGGVHLVFRCSDVPDEVLKLKSPLALEAAPKITGEVYVNGANIVLSPSVHKSGQRYFWEVTGEIPVWSWEKLVASFGVAWQAKKAPGRPKKEKPWWSRFQGDLGTLDLVALMQQLGLLGELLDADKRTHSVRCPWAGEHADGGREWTPRQSSTVIFEGRNGKWPSFKCLHTHCAERNLEQLLGWAETQAPGIVDRFCAAARVWSGSQQSADGARPRSILPGIGRPDSVFATEIGQILARKFAWFNFANNPVIVRESAEKTATSAGLHIHMVAPVEAITEIESHVEIGRLRTDEAGDTVFVPASMKEATARVLLASPQLRRSLPVIRRVLDVALPILEDGTIVYPNCGFDPRFGTFLAADAPDVTFMSLDEARALILTELLGGRENGGFCWADAQSRCHAVARILTPFCRGLMGWARPPLWIVEANRERCGKDFFAQIPALLFLGRLISSPPPTKDSDEEIRKRITTALMANARMLHFANVKGHVRYASLEAATDNTGAWQDRILGGNTEACLPNETEFSFSANAGTTWEPDIEGRSRRIALRYEKEEINARTFRHPDLHAWVMENRPQLLSALAAFVTEWDRQGRPVGPSPFSSFPQWARIVGGIMHACELGNPCLPHADASKITGDQHTESMKRLFALGFEAFGSRDVKKPEIYELVSRNQVDGLLESLDLTSRSGQTQLGKMLAKFSGRELGKIRMIMPNAGKNNLVYRFLPTEEDAPEEGTWEHEGTFSCPTQGREKCDEKMGEEKKDNLGGTSSSRANVPEGSHVPSLVQDSVELGRIAEEIALADSALALDIETYNENKGGGALSPFTPGAEIRLLTLALPGREPWIIDLRAVGYDLGELGGVIEGSVIVGHNLKFDLLWLLVKCGILPRRVFCSLIASRLLTAGSMEPNDLGAVLARHLDIHLPKDQGRSDWGGMLLTPDQLRYSADDVRHLHALRAKLEEALTAADLNRVRDLEMELLPVVVEIEAAGFPVDRGRLEEIAREAGQLMAGATEQVRQLLNAPELNPSSPVQLKDALGAIGIVVDGTSLEVLSNIDHPAAHAILTFREHEKTAQQALSLSKEIRSDGRIHAGFDPVGTITGRFSSKQPNLQNVKRGAMRTAFRAPEGMRLVVADYSQIELRAAAVIANDPIMLDALRKGEDLHRKTAALVLGKPEGEITTDERQNGKASNFGLIFGQTPGGLVDFAKTNYNVELSVEETTRMRERFFASYRGIAAWHKQAWRSASALAGSPNSYALTVMGRRRLLPLGGKDWSRFTTLVNTPVQGTCGDGMKLAMARLGAVLPPGAQMVATIHDELVVLTDAEQAEPVRALVVEEMQKAMAELLPGVPIEVEASVCSNWGEK